MFNIDKLHEIRAMLALLDSKPHIIALSEVKPKTLSLKEICQNIQSSNMK